MEPTPYHGATPPPLLPPLARPRCAQLLPAPAWPGLAFGRRCRRLRPCASWLPAISTGEKNDVKRRPLTSGSFSSSPLVAPKSALRCVPSPAVPPVEHIHGVAASRWRPAAAPSRRPFAGRPPSVRQSPSARRSKVGQGLSRDDKALNLAFQHWIEAIDPLHRYGHNLHFYYDVWWCQSQAGQPFFYWLDIGEGKDVDVPRCPRALLKKQSLKYLGLHASQGQTHQWPRPS